MSTPDTAETLLKLAVAAEQKNREFYQGLSKMFSHLPEIAYFWQGMVMEEIQHIQKLENIRDALTLEQLSAPADKTILQKARNTLTFSASDTLNSIKTLEDAYQTASDLERSEVNTVFSFITSKFVPSAKQKEFILWQLENHTQKMVKFPEIFGDTEARKKISSKPALEEPEVAGSLQAESKVSVL
jgi:hypothetical protein